ncbi:dihydrolipoyl dehydrogenase [candidate division WOR-1 bacterium RIFOXYA12_FULL_52_29]|uniref:Dihydrolipoyl dehydrogenase n=1 Tax=candidate division WOR-1 bacterium RIFOXYC12_FULL_54_18 TaxID=1802584 RepID=A0A1F4T7W2_UNCSA|nr:MAG: dihydrolipoyl dehydrogenase [candidate division WOR-1 bacterium RIFOXYA2_FULL_51_19]OGC17756.1 MAG: dihydrolipoyl dehydrogenase [candidate division WOR-1 bacterium RIFOXYA12_FULL_52_29]OGC26613.1 MAG: dihydrolipoyl dehydrogenase [candidate division WOR-1 bacterium RIFOXYB2_FULL_45_9]OGC28173.1 MAG: dihydrolipoyl dehydrogenase [candidate division WOR-1 bacterium RIFOXYC12_FULL_54_18]OGC29541.1 MAG: dihydrolipoyl dehydrogenase [candidate division WOR-1 bacterium RIFOXYB12_FULL_52_16]
MSNNSPPSPLLTREGRKEFDLAILGGGPGGYAAAIRAAQLGAKVVLIEQDKVGGTCLNRGCIPTKALIASTNFYERMQKAESLGLSATNISIDFAKVVARKNEVVAKLVKGLAGLIEKNGIEIIYGQGEVVAPGLIKINNRDVQSRAIILATGSLPASLPGVAHDGKKFICSDEALELAIPPARLDIIGGGVIGIHFAMIYSSLGTAITIYEAQPEILPGVDDEVVAMVKRLLKRKKIEVLTGTFFDPQKAGEVSLICVGRTPNLTGIEALGLRQEGKRVWVNEKMETSLPNIYAVGDLVSLKQFAHVGYEQGVVAAENALGGNRSYNYDCVPYGIYTQPEIAGVGLTEKEARVKNPNIKTGKFPFGALGIAQAMGEIEGFVKFVADEKGKILGVHIIGPEATALIGMATLAIKNNLTIEQFGSTFQAHPSYPEGMQEAAEAVLNRALHIEIRGLA